MARHTFATTNALAQGIRIEVVSRMLGHTNEHDAALCEDFGGEYQSGDEKNRRNTIGIVWNIDRQRGGPSKPRPLSVFILSFQTVDRRETFVLPVQLCDDLGVAAPDDPPEPCGGGCPDGGRGLGFYCIRIETAYNVRDNESCTCREKKKRSGVNQRDNI